MRLVSWTLQSSSEHEQLVQIILEFRGGGG